MARPMVGPPCLEDPAMSVLVAYATRHGATRGIAERIATRLTEIGVPADARNVTEIRDPAGYDAFVVGSAAYMFHWLKDATAFVKRNQRLLAGWPVWLFSSGPLGTDLVDAKGRDVIETSVPKEFAEFENLIRPRGTKIFFGAWDPSAPPVTLADRFVRLMPASIQTEMPAGDFRDWPAIDAWADAIAAELREPARPEMVGTAV
jgi:menaquinone-dependent protoporphyrinogen oxidase